MRDDILREEYSAARREAIWKRVRPIVEMNSNVRASVKEGRLGEISRVWEWIGNVAAIEDGGDRRRSGRKWLGPAAESPERSASPNAVGELRKWDEGRPVY